MWHKELKAWLQRAQGGEPPMKTPTGERGSYLFFEVNSWTTARKDGFVLEYAALDETPRRR
jgi:CCR4-NOT transcription complex subunit 2